ncbi:hypothetical protein HPB47_018719, partial [Ixodes persulcatus]
MPGCCTFGCNNGREAGKQLFCITEGKKHRKERLLWLSWISRTDFTPTSCTRLCK